jgi:hypothetical protein
MARVALAGLRLSYAAWLLAVLVALQSAVSPQLRLQASLASSQSTAPVPTPISEEEESHGEVRHVQAGGVALRRAAQSRRPAISTTALRQALPGERSIRATSFIAKERNGLNGCGAFLRC